VDLILPPLPKTEKGKARRERILDAAQAAFAVHGYRNVSLASIAPTVGITEQGVMHYFPTKTHLLLGVLERRRERDTQRFVPMLERVSFPALMIEVMRHNVERDSELAALDAVMRAEAVDPDHPAHRWFAERTADLRKQMALGVARSQQAGDVRADLDPDDVAMHLLALLDGFILQWAMDPRHFDPVGAMRSYIATLEPSKGLSS